MNRKIIISALLLALIIFIANFITDIFLDIQWFASYGHSGAFWTLFLTEFNVHVFFSFTFFMMFLFNIVIMRAIFGNNFMKIPLTGQLSGIRILKKPELVPVLIIMSVGVIISYMMGALASSYWREILLFLNRSGSEGLAADPVFSKTVDFYMFTFPFMKLIHGWLTGAIIIIAVFSAVFHFISGSVNMNYGRVSLSEKAGSHFSALAVFFMLVYSWSFRLASYSLLLKERGKFFGAGYSDVHSQLTGYTVCTFLCIAAAIIMIFNIFRRSTAIFIYTISLLVPVIFVLTVIIPAAQQRFFVIPNELDMERPFIESNIKFTRSAYDIDRINIIDFQNDSNLTSSDIENNRSTLDNIRLWDWKPLQQTYKQMQELKPYYTFLDVDVDRYMIDGRKIAVNLSAREISTEKLSQQTRTWVNRHLIYTHGYGLVMSRVDTITPEGLPEMVIKDIPPSSNIAYGIDRPEIYYGEHSNDYVLTNTKITPGEFNYPSGESNNYSTYSGKGGVKVGSFLKRLLFAISLKDLNILISSNITSDSRILYRRNIREMVTTLTPYILFDKDPYLVLSEGKLYWIIDGYTVSSRYPYSTPVVIDGKEINYMRNSVKVIIDAYNGSMNYYISDKTDPIINTFSRIFPTIFKSMDLMPEDLRNHIRYPEMFFNVQSAVLLRYHMQDANVFYNNEDLWSVPEQIYAENKIKIEPSYLVTKLPDENQPQFIIILPFTPSNKDNMIGFMTANCDRQNYGELKLYRLPKQSMTYGPMQIESRINQDAEISKQLTLWNQKGSQVIRGNITVLPINSSLLFIEPLYLKADTSEMPELKRVILSFADRIIMAENLDKALDIMFSDNGISKIANDTMRLPSDKPVPASVSNEMIKEAYESFKKAERFISSGDWENYGKEMEKVKKILEKLNRE